MPTLLGHGEIISPSKKMFEFIVNEKDEEEKYLR